MKKSHKFAPESRKRAVRTAQEQRGESPSLCAAIEWVAPNIGCVAQTLLHGVKHAEVDGRTGPGKTMDEAQREGQGSSIADAVYQACLEGPHARLMDPRSWQSWNGPLGLLGSD